MRVREKINPGKSKSKNSIRKEKARRREGGRGGKKEVLPSSQTRQWLG
jgi:hypothetical protein